MLPWVSASLLNRGVKNLYRGKLVLQVTLNQGEWTLRYVESDSNWGEQRGKMLSQDAKGWYIPLSNRKGFRARLYFEVNTWQ